MLAAMEAATQSRTRKTPEVRRLGTRFASGQACPSPINGDLTGRISFLIQTCRPAVACACGLSSENGMA